MEKVVAPVGEEAKVDRKAKAAAEKVKNLEKSKSSAVERSKVEERSKVVERSKKVESRAVEERRKEEKSKMEERRVVAPSPFPGKPASPTKSPRVVAPWRHQVALVLSLLTISLLKTCYFRSQSWHD